MIDIRATVARFGSLLVPGWGVSIVRLAPERMPIKGALAVCDPTPTRELLRLYIVEPWPENEDLAETIAHEMTHGMISPLTALLGNNPHAIMTEERIVERLGKVLATVPVGQARAMARAVQRYAPQLRARLKISSLATRARDGGKNMMDAGMVKAALDAIESGDSDKCKELLKALIAAEVTEGEAMEGAGEEMAQMAEGAPAPEAGGAPPMDARMVARMKRTSDELELIAKDARASGKKLLIDGLRARLGEHTGLPAIEKRINAATDYRAAKMIADIAADLAPADGAQRARSGLTVKGAPADASGMGIEPPHSIADLVKEGLPAQFAQEFHATFKVNPDQAMAELNGARARLAQRVNPWAPTTGANGAQKAS